MTWGNHKNRRMEPLRPYLIAILMTGFGITIGPQCLAYEGGDLPKADAIMDRFVEVTGGKAAYEKVKNRVTTATLEVPSAGMKAKLTSYHSSSPDRLYMTTELPGMGTSEQGVSGDIVWEKGMMGPRLKDGDEKEMMRREVVFNSEVNWRKLFKEWKTVALEDVDGKPSYKIELTPLEGKPETRYFDKDTGLLVKSTAMIATPMGELPLEVFMSDYKDVGGVKVAHKLRQKVGPQELLMTVEKVEQNVEIPAERFEPPAEVKALAAKQGNSKPAEAKPDGAAPKNDDKKGP